MGEVQIDYSKRRAEKSYNIKDNYYLDVDIHYDQGEMNYFLGARKVRGYYILFQTVQTKGERKTFMVGDDISGENIKNAMMLLEPAKRYSKKRLKALADSIDFDHIAQLWLDKKYNEAIDCLTNN
jgi:hypothetical protein